jgi:hypothetical protein
MTDIAIASTALNDREAGEDLAAQLRDDLGGAPPDALIVFASARLRLRVGCRAKELDSAPFAGFNSYGQIVRADGQFGGFHNCTAVVCVFPD